MALLDSRETFHEACAAQVRNEAGPLVTTWPCVTEAMRLLYRNNGPAGQAALWGLVDSDDLVIMDLDRGLRDRTRDLMRKYASLPMALADGTLVAVAERLREQTVFTLDGHFSMYRLNGRQPIRVIPSSTSA